MVETINQIIAIFIIGATSLFFLYCFFISGKRPSIEIVMKIYSFIMLFAFSIILIFSIFEPTYFEWIRQSILSMTLIAMIIIAIAFQIIANRH